VTAKGLGTIFRPLFFKYYKDDTLLLDKYLDTEILIGDDLIITPILKNSTV